VKAAFGNWQNCLSELHILCEWFGLESVPVNCYAKVLLDYYVLLKVIGSKLTNGERNINELTRNMSTKQCKVIFPCLSGREGSTAKVSCFLVTG
jgi:hypothetical protein